MTHLLRRGAKGPPHRSPQAVQSWRAVCWRASSTTRRAKTSAAFRSGSSCGNSIMRMASAETRTRASISGDDRIARRSRSLSLYWSYPLTPSLRKGCLGNLYSLKNLSTELAPQVGLEPTANDPQLARRPGYPGSDWRVR